MNKQPEQSKPVSLSQNHPDWYDPKWGDELVANLNRNVLASAERLKPGADWSEWRHGDRTFRVSPDRKQARELMADGNWRIVVTDYVLTKASRPRTDQE